jgi:hypothetical protein
VPQTTSDMKRKSSQGFINYKKQGSSSNLFSEKQGGTTPQLPDVRFSRQQLQGLTGLQGLNN